MKWESGAIALSLELMRAQRDVLLGEDPVVPLSRRAEDRLGAVREARASQVSAGRLVAEQRGPDLHFWTWAGLKANETLRAALGSPEGQSENEVMVLRDFRELDQLQSTSFNDVVPRVFPEMVDALKFSAALPGDLAMRTLGERLADRAGAIQVAGDPRLRRQEGT